MYALVEDNNITQFINQPKSIVVGDVRYPAKIFQLWSQSEKEAIGIYEIIVDKTNYKDPAYYNNTTNSFRSHKAKFIIRILFVNFDNSHLFWGRR